MSPIDHILIYILLFGFTYYFSINSSKFSSGKYAEYACSFIILFSIIEGCRYGRGPDFLDYKYRFEHIDIHEPQKGFLFLMQLLHNIDFNYVGVFICYAFLFISGVVYFINHTFDKYDARWMYLFAVFALLIKFEGMIRQFIAFPFLLVAFSFFFRKKWELSILFLLIAISFHTAIIATVPLVLLFFIFVKKKIPLKISIPLLFIVYYILPDGFFVDRIVNLVSGFDISSFTGNDQFSNYTSDADRWIGEDSYLADAAQTDITKMSQFLFEIGAIVIGYISLKIKPNQIILTFYNLMIIGFISCRLFFGYEILYRITEQFRFFWFIPVAFAFSVNRKMIEKKNLNYFFTGCIIVALYNIMYFGRFIFLFPDATFFWNKNI